MARKTYYPYAPDYERLMCDREYRGYGGPYKVVIEKNHFVGGLIFGILVAILAFAVMVSLNDTSSQTNASSQAYDQPSAPAQETKKTNRISQVPAIYINHFIRSGA